MKYILIILSFGLFLFAPTGYSIPFCIACAAVYLYMAFLTLKKEITNKTYFSFNLLFWISMFCTTFIVPLFVLPTGFRYTLDFYANKGTSMVVFSMSLYYAGWISAYHKSRQYDRMSCCSIRVNKTVVRVLSVFSLLVTFLYIYQYAIFLRTSTAYDNDIGLGFTYTLIQSILCSALVVSSVYNKNSGIRSLSSFITNNSILLGCYAIIIVTSVFIGDRTMPIYLALCILGCYVFFIKRIRFITQWGLILVAAAVMVTIGKTRTTDSSFREGGLGSIGSTTVETISSAETAVELFSDFMPATSALYACIDWRASNNNKLFYPLKIFKIPFSPLPYVPTLMARGMFGVENSELSSASLTTHHFSERVMDISGGLGTHAVGDIYVSWGIIGIFFFFYMFGIVLGTSQRRLYENIYWSLTYFALLSNALYIPRASILDNYRAIVFELFFVWLAGRISGKSIVNKDKAE